MFDMNKIMSLTADEVMIINGLRDVAKEAKEDAELIRKVYHCFGIGEDRIEVWHDPDRNNFEYLTHDGVWQARYLHQNYNVRVDAETIFDYYRAGWLVENGYAEDVEDCSLTEYGEKMKISRYFRSFVKKVKSIEATK